MELGLGLDMRVKSMIQNVSVCAATTVSVLSIVSQCCIVSSLSQLTTKRLPGLPLRDTVSALARGTPKGGHTHWVTSAKRVKRRKMVLGSVGVGVGVGVGVTAGEGGGWD